MFPSAKQTPLDLWNSQPRIMQRGRDGLDLHIDVKVCKALYQQMGMVMTADRRTQYGLRSVDMQGTTLAFPHGSHKPNLAIDVGIVQPYGNKYDI